MSKGAYIGIEGVARKVKDIYIGVDGVAGKVKKAYLGVNGVASLCWEDRAGEVPVRADCLTFSSDEAFTIAQNDTFRNWDGTLWYSNDTESWAEWDGTTIMESSEHEGSQKIYVRGSGNVRISGSLWQFIGNPWRMTGSNIRCSGNIENLLDYEVVARGEHPAMEEYCFTCMFEGCTALIEAPILPATALAPFCYWGMFWGCTGLTAAPVLPATVLSDLCYSNMFHACSGLKKAPELPAAEMVDRCYNGMFNGCSSLKVPPKLPAAKLANGCYYGMFQGCTSFATIPSLPAEELVSDCYGYMFYGCTGVRLSEMQADEYQTVYRIPASGEGMEASNAVKDMFTNTGGTFTGTPEINKTYYTSNAVV